MDSAVLDTKQRGAKLNTIEQSEASKAFMCKAEVGQYVAYWVDHEETTSMPLVSKSHATEEECLEACSECLDDPWLADDLGRTLRETGRFIPNLRR